MKKIICLMIGGIILCLSYSTVRGEDSGVVKNFEVTAKFVPPQGKTLLMIGQDRETIAKYVDATKIPPAGVMIYSSIQSVDGLDDRADYGAGYQDGTALLSTYSNSVIQLGLYMVGGLEDTIAGKYDANIKLLALWIKNANRPVYLRIGYEFDLPDNNYDPEKYKDAYRHIVDLLRKLNIRNVAYVWHSSILMSPTRPWTDWYPGDEYVDWFGASVFSSSKIFGATRFRELARQYNKPFMIAEATPQGSRLIPSKSDWFKQVFRFINAQEVEAFCYINSNWEALTMWKGQGWGDQRVEKDPKIQELWLNEIRQDRYLQASPDLFKSLGWKPAQESQSQKSQI